MLHHEIPDITGFLERIHENKISKTEVVQQFLNRLLHYHPKINAATKIYAEEALHQADSASGKLAGIPFSVKEMYDLEGEQLNYATTLYKTSIAKQDADAIARLKSEGAIVLCKSNIPELSMFTETNNLVFGRCNNPLDIERTSGGSSGGDGALVSSASVGFGLGSDIGGSIRIPAAFCGCVGFKPSSFEVSKIGSHHDLQGTFSDNCLSNGPLTRSVRDAFLVYDVLTHKHTETIENTKEIRVLIPEDFTMRFEHKNVYQSFEYIKSFCAIEFANCETFIESRMNEVSQEYLRLLIFDVYERFKNILSDSDGNPFSVKKEAYNQIAGNPTVWNQVFISMVGMRVLNLDNQQHYKLVKKMEGIKREYEQRLDHNTVMILPTIGISAPKHGELLRMVNNPILSRILNPTVFCNIFDFSAIAIPDFIHKNQISQLPASVMVCGLPSATRAIYTVAKIIEKQLQPH